MKTSSQENHLPLSGKNALVTGASRGIGAAIALDLSRAGAAVAVNYCHSPDKAEALCDEIKRAGGRAMTVKADMAKRADIEAMLTSGVLALDGLDAFGNLYLSRLLPWSFGLLNFARHLPGTLGLLDFARLLNLTRARHCTDQHHPTDRESDGQAASESTQVDVRHHRPPIGNRQLTTLSRR